MLARCWLIGHDSITRCQYVYGRKFALHATFNGDDHEVESGGVLTIPTE